MRRYQSRLSEVEEQKSIKSAFVFGGLTILVIVLALVFGIPLFSKFVNLFDRTTSTPLSENNTSLMSPTLSTLPEYTNQKTLEVKGTGQPNSTVKVFFNKFSDQTVADDTGSFGIKIGLEKGSNTIYAKTVDETNASESNSSSIYTVNFTDQEPNLTINVPQNNQSFYGPTQKNLNIQGTTDAGNNVTVNDHIAIVDSSGKFNFPMNLQDGNNELKIVSTDRAGNKKEIVLKVSFTP